MAMPHELIEDALGDPRNATALAQASDLAYLGPDAGAKAYRDEFGMDARLFSVGNTQAWVAGNDDHLLVAFRGTEAPTSIEGLKDWLLTDAVNLLILPEGRLGTDLVAAGVGARFHMGFVNALADIWGPVQEAVEAELKRKDRPLWVTGHSLGGALAMLSTWMFNRKFLPVHQVYTYGAPMIGNSAASEAFDRAFPEKIYRYVNSDDPVPRLPTLSLIANDYSHCLKEVSLGAVGDSVSNALELFKQVGSGAVNGLLNPTQLGEFWDNIRGRVAAHALESYRKLILEGLARR
jgi:hypothetical protein